MQFKKPEDTCKLVHLFLSSLLQSKAATTGQLVFDLASPNLQAIAANVKTWQLHSLSDQTIEHSV